MMIWLASKPTDTSVHAVQYVEQQSHIPNVNATSITDNANHAYSIQTSDQPYSSSPWASTGQNYTSTAGQGSVYDRPYYSASSAPIGYSTTSSSVQGSTYNPAPIGQNYTSSTAQGNTSAYSEPLAQSNVLTDPNDQLAQVKGSGNNTRKCRCIAATFVIIVPTVIYFVVNNMKLSSTSHGSSSNNLMDSSESSCFDAAYTYIPGSLSINGYTTQTASLVRQPIGNGSTFGVSVSAEYSEYLQACSDCYYYFGFVGRTAYCIPTGTYSSLRYTFFTNALTFTKNGCYQLFFTSRQGSDFSCRTLVTSGSIIGAVFVSDTPTSAPTTSSPAIRPTRAPTVFRTRSPTVFPTMVSNRRVSCYANSSNSFGSSVSVNGVAGNKFTFSSPATVNIAYKWYHAKTTSCPACFIQLYVGITSYDGRYTCKATSGNQALTYTLNFQVTITSPGCYYIFRSEQFGYNCGYFGAVWDGQRIGSIYVS